jgi:arsenate reductase
MAEAFLNAMAGDKFEAYSAGLEPGTLNPYVVRVMKEIDIDISSNLTKSVFDFYKRGEHFGFVITVCDESNSERCPIFPGASVRLHWGFSDPSSFEGSDDEKLEMARKIRDQIQEKLKNWINQEAKC